jgi:hypothetical protein
VQVRRAFLSLDRFVAIALSLFAYLRHRHAGELAAGVEERFPEEEEEEELGVDVHSWLPGGVVCTLTTG